MKILFAGNSQAGCLKKALELSMSSEYTAIKKADWCVVPGGWGPNLRLSKDRIEIDSYNSRFPPRFHPSESILCNSVNKYDTIVISALGFIDGGFAYSNPISSAHRYYPVNLALRKRDDSFCPVSQSCLYEIAANKISATTIGFRFLRQLREVFRGAIIVQPFPLLSSAIANRGDWSLADDYRDPLLANEFFLRIKDLFLANICNELDCMLLPYPDPLWRKKGFTPCRYINDSDMLHPTVEYGGLILRQIDKALKSFAHM